MSRSAQIDSQDEDGELEILKSLVNRGQLASWLGVSEKGLCHLLYVLPKESLYSTFEVPKKSGGTRIIEAPIQRLKALQRRLLRKLSCIYQPKSFVHGFTSNRSIISNASAHVRRGFVLNIDLEDFFPSINFGRVRGLFLAHPYNCTEQVATVLAQICCFDGKLPQGAPTSPIISNMICSRFDHHLSKLSYKYKCRYSRYADDITISCSRNEFPNKLAKLIFSEEKNKHIPVLGSSLLKTIEANGFRVNTSKVRLQLHNQRQIVTGLLTNAKVNVPREFIRNVRSMLRNWEIKGLAQCQTDFMESLGGLTSVTEVESDDKQVMPVRRFFKETLRSMIFVM